MPNYLTDFYQEIRDIYSNNYRSKELEDRFIKAGKDKACRIISKLKPRVNQRTNINITASAAFVALPSDFLGCYLPAIYKLKYNAKLEDSSLKEILVNIYDKKTYYSSNSISSKFTPEGRVRYIPPTAYINSYQDEGFCIEIFQNDTKTFSLWFDEDQAVSARTETNFSYSGIHQIEESKDTVTNDIRDEFIDLCLYHACLEAQRQLAKEAQTSSDIQKANIFGEQAIFYSKSINSLASLGIAD